MQSAAPWRLPRPGLSLGRALFLAALLHTLFVLALLLADLIPPFQKRIIKIRTDGAGTISITMGGGKIPEPVGSDRKIEVQNPTPPKPPDPPKPTPAKPVAKPTPETIKKPIAKPAPTPPKKPETLPTPKTVKKPAEPTKKTLATPSPKPPDKKPETPAKAPIADSVPQLSAPPPLPDLPKIDAKGSKDGGPGAVGLPPGGALPSIGGAEGITLPGSYLADAFNRISSNFSYPSYYKSQLPRPVFCTVSFRVHLDGAISHIQVQQSSGDPALDAFARRALEKTVSLLPLKPYITQDIGKDYLSAAVPFLFGPENQ